MPGARRTGSSNLLVDASRERNRKQFAFIVPLKCREMASCWERVSQLCERTLRSICAQTDGSFRVIVVCNERPAIAFEHPAIEFVQVDFRPDGEGGGSGPMAANEDDKARRISTAMEWLRADGSMHVMVVDADDCVHDGIVAHARQAPSARGWFAASGYVYREGARTIYRKRREFQKVCGTCLVLRGDLASKALLAKPNGRLWYAHSSTRLAGEELAPLPFPAAIYVIANGENYSMTAAHEQHLRGGSKYRNPAVVLRRLRDYRISPIRGRLREIYGLYPLGPPHDPEDR